jgi:diadenosine tetraphosphate (Ap4A) HIT family hydrolase
VTSPFLAAPPSSWVASNALAFALPDESCPVSPGHTLVVPRRVVATWFDASPEERTAIVALVDEVKSILDARHHPDGYNIGIDAGEAAGQTVMHLHVHVIPRYRGDADDPPGGVRRVIHSGSIDLAPSALATGGASDPFLRHLAPLFGRATEIAVVAAFVLETGLSDLEGHLLNALARGVRVRVLTGNYLDITQVGALRKLVAWSGGGRARIASPCSTSSATTASSWTGCGCSPRSAAGTTARARA